MNGEQVASLIRTAIKALAALPFGAAAFHALGIDPTSNTGMYVAGAVAFFGALVWSHVTHSDPPSPPPAAPAAPAA